jgi:peptidoglycan/LPS O-acetylase OafA/YrhL
MGATTDTDTRRRLRYEPALDGIRGFAVLLVVLWHYPTDILERPFAWLKAGHLGVDVFFVLSGFLITALMLNEFDRVGRISFGGFYRRRAFRLLPALFLFLSAHVVWAILTDIPTGVLSPGTDARNEIASVLGAQFFVLNWLQNFGDYSITLGLGHLWSLSVEEQFYIVWPTITVLLLSPRRLPSLIITGLAGGAVMYAGHNYVWTDGGVVSRWGPTLGIGLAVVFVLERIRPRQRTVWILAVLVTFIGAALLYRNGLYEGGQEVFRLYSGTPSRADSLLIGAGFAFIWVEGWIPHRGPVWAALIGWAVLLWAVFTQTLADPFFYRAGWTIVALSALLIIWGSLGAADTLYGRILSMRWLRGVGKVAYGLYLWHAFVFIAVRHWWGDGSVLWKTILALGLTTIVTSASWFLVEKPLLAFKSRTPVVPAPAVVARPDRSGHAGVSPTDSPRAATPAAGWGRGRHLE